MAPRKRATGTRGRAVRAAAEEEILAPGEDAPAEDRSQATSPAEIEDSLDPDDDDWDLDVDGDDPGDEDGAFAGSLPSVGESLGHESLGTQRWGEGDLIDDDGVKWQEPALLDAPPAREGMRQRWIRVETREGADANNFSKAMRQGYRPRNPDTVPGGFSAPTLNHGVFGQCIKVEGMVLMEMPERIAREREAHYAGRIDKLDDAITADLEAVKVKGGPPIHRRARSEATIGGVRRRPRSME